MSFDQACQLIYTDRAQPYQYCYAHISVLLVVQATRVCCSEAYNHRLACFKKASIDSRQKYAGKTGDKSGSIRTISSNDFHLVDKVEYKGRYQQNHAFPVFPCTQFPEIILKSDGLLTVA